MRGAAAEEVAEHQAHDQQLQQGGQDAPGHAQDGALVFVLEVPVHKLLKKEKVPFQFFQC